MTVALDSNLVLTACICWIVLELLFWLFVHFVIVKKVQTLSKPQKYSIEPLKLIKKVMDTIDEMESYNFDMFVHGFFRGAKLSDLCKENMRSFLSWAMFASRLTDLSPEDTATLDLGYEESCRRYGSLKDGFNPDVKHIAMTLEPVPYIHRPLLLYILFGVCDLFANILYFKAKGFQKFEMNDRTYWYKPACRNNATHLNDNQNTEKPIPLVFYHGISPGWLSYAR